MLLLVPPVGVQTPEESVVAAVRLVYARGDASTLSRGRREAIESNRVFGVVGDRDQRLPRQLEVHDHRLARPGHHSALEDVLLRRRHAAALQSVDDLVDRDAFDQQLTPPLMNRAARDLVGLSLRFTGVALAGVQVVLGPRDELVPCRECRRVGPQRAGADGQRSYRRERRKPGDHAALWMSGRRTGSAA